MVQGGNAEEDEDRWRAAFFTIAVCHGLRAVKTTVAVCYTGHRLLRRGVSLIVDGSAVFLAAEADGQKGKACRGGRVSWGKSRPFSGAARADGFDDGCNGNADLRICQRRVLELELRTEVVLKEESCIHRNTAFLVLLLSLEERVESLKLKLLKTFWTSSVMMLHPSS
ncbi:hypothetical protein ACFX2H_013437 [Malus domestica]